MNPPKVDVLLATYNGGEFLNEFLESLTRQGEIAVTLIVGDDGSEDDTLEILDNYRGKFAEFKLYKFNRIGPKANFLKLINESQADFIAFADQDDIWEEKRLENAVCSLRDKFKPTLLISPMSILGSSIKIETKIYHFPRNLMRNNVHGCTQIFNSKLRDIVKLGNPNNLVMHDWWTVLVADLYGEIMLAKGPKTLYRLHANNFIGIPSFRKKLGFYLEFLLKRKKMNLVVRQAEELLSIRSNFYHQEDKNYIQSWLFCVQGNFSDRIIFCLKEVLRKRVTLSDSIKISIGLYE
jgi:glycosyltransferase involved in cell wall biosynthesis